MCGICGNWGRGKETFTEAMMAKLRHRGPDAAGVHRGARGYLGHRRLSIMDTSGGDQPIYNEDGALAVIANGEIYNYPDLRRQLEDRHTFRTGNDSEVILHLYEEYGPRAVDHLDGMFAFCLADGDDLFIARDYIGIKPLYYAIDDDGFHFASELKAISRFGERVHEFPTGSTYSTAGDIESFYDLPAVHAEDHGWEAHARALRAALERAVEKRLMSDVPVGAFLSGGLDSSVIAAICARHVDDLHTFSVGLEGSRDLAAARIVADHIGSIHHEYVMTPDEIAEKLPEIIYYLESYDQDLVRSAVPCYFTSRLARRHVKVILTGEGADELFGGYAYYEDIDDDRVLADELRRSVSTLHNINLQRVDRLTMAHSLEGRVPFLDAEMIRLGLTIPARWKRQGNPPVEKWILRKACEDLLPDEIAWRKKEQFDEGSGAADLLPHLIAERLADAADRVPVGARRGHGIRSREEAGYYHLFRDVFAEPDTIAANMGRWAMRPEFDDSAAT